MSIELGSPWFECVVCRTKTAIIQPNTPDWQEYKEGDSIEIHYTGNFNENSLDHEPFKAKIVFKKEYPNILKFLKNEERMERALPGVTDLDLAIRFYSKFLSDNEQEIKEYGILVLYLERKYIWSSNK